jgi:uncharacterized Ntn-hydrolase superfamily protein
VTFSIVARSSDGDCWGVAVASKFLAVGAVVPAAVAGAGALATQAFANLAYRPDGLRLLAEGLPASNVVSTLTGADEQRELRQLGVVDRDGGAATYTGPGCHDWAGGCAGDGYAVQGNILVGEQVVAAVEASWLAGDQRRPLARLLFDALLAGDEAGGDRRGRQSAALLVVTPGGGYGGGSDLLVDLRVDDHPLPMAELGRLLDLHELYFGKPDPATLLPLTGPVADEVRERLAVLGHRQEDLDGALADWAGIENYEERLVPGSIDPVILGKLREASPG